MKNNPDAGGGPVFKQSAAGKAIQIVAALRHSYDHRASPEQAMSLLKTGGKLTRIQTHP